MAGEPIADARPARRDVLRLGAWSLLAPAVLVAGCDIRLQDDAPALPLLQRKSVPDEATLVAAVRLTTALAQRAGRVPQPSPAVTALAAQHQTQAGVLRARLTGQGVPLHVIDTDPVPGDTATATPTGGATATAAVSAPPAATTADLAAAEGAAVSTLLGPLPTVTAADRPVLLSVAAACAIAAEQLGAATGWPTGDPLPATAAVSLLDSTRSAVYAFQVVAAQTSGDVRGRALTTHTRLQSRAAELLALAGPSAPPAPLGYVLPFPVTDADAATRLAGQVLSTLVAGGLEPLAAVPTGSSAVVPLARLLVAAAGLARGWGVATGPFPGLAYP